CFNGAAYVREAIRSVQNQTYRELECIVVDDASTDGSAQLVQSIAASDNRVRSFVLDRNGGPAAARNFGINVATGDWIALLDADALYADDRLERLFALARQTGASAVIDNQSVRTFPDGPHLFSGFRFLRGDQPTEINASLFFSEEAKSDTYL